MKNTNPHNSPLIRSVAPEKAVVSIREQMRLSRLAIVSKGFENIHNNGYQTDAAAITIAMQTPAQTAERPDNVVELRRPATEHEALTQEALRQAVSAEDMYGRLAS